MEIWANTTLYISLWTIIAVAFFLWKLSANIAKFQKETEMQLKQHEERLDKLDSLDLDSRLTEIQTNLKRIMKKMEERK